MQKLDLNGQWQLYYFKQGTRDISHPDMLWDVESITAVVPGNVELDLSRAGELPQDIFFAGNIKALKPYELYEWWFVKEFNAALDNPDGEIILSFQGVDCLAEYWLNGEKLGSSCNMFIEKRFNITGKLKMNASNTLHVRLRSPMAEAMEKEYDPLTANIWGQTNLAQIWIRKAAHSYGWDIMPRALSAGLWRPVEIVVQEKNTIKDLYFNTSQIGENRAELNLFYDLTADPGLFEDMYLEISGCCGESVFNIKEKVVFKTGILRLDIEHPELWWPRGYGRAALYDVTARLLHKDCVISESKTRLGIRTIELIQNAAEGNETPSQFLFKVNGTPILCKGSNWVPADAFHSRDAERYEKSLELFTDLGCNIVRCWGGNVYEDHGFYDICDREGLMVWQDFSMACAAYPQSRSFLETIRDEAISIVRKLRHHPCIALWAGDNECDALLYEAGFNPDNNRITREVLPQAVFQCDPYRPYLPSSPYISREIAVKRKIQNVPENHLWGPRDYYKSNYYTGSKARFISEIGYHGCPNLSSVKRFIDAGHIWPWQNEQWILHSADHLNKLQRTKLMFDQVKELFGTEPDNIEDFVIASQISQAEAVKFFIEMVRLKKWDKTGIIWWNVIDGWPQFSDAIVDYYYGKKLAYYYIKRVQQPFCIMLDEPDNWQLRVVAGNDSLTDISGEYCIQDADTDEILLQGRFNSRANENSTLGHIRVSRSERKLFLIEWTANGKKYGNHYLLGYPPFSIGQYQVWLKKIAALEDCFDANGVGK